MAQDIKPQFNGDFLGAGLGAAIIIGAALASVYASGHSGSTVVTSAVSDAVILLAALVGLIIVARALGITSRKEALGLPKGSVRALLAFGLLIIFSVVALLTLGGSGQKTEAPLLISQTFAAGEVPGELTKFQAQFPAPRFAVVVVPDASGAGAAGTESGGAPAASSAAPEEAAAAGAGYGDSKIEVFAVGESDAQKQVLTMIGTALVTVIGFYFGGKSATDAASAASAAISPAAPTGTPDAKPVPTASAIQNLAAQVKSIAQAAKALLDGLGPDPLTVLKEAAEGNPDAKVQQRLADATAALDKLTQAVATTQSDSDRAAVAASAISSTETSVDKLSQAQDALTNLLQVATSAKSDADKGLADFKAADGDILALTAKG